MQICKRTKVQTLPIEINQNLHRIKMSPKNQNCNSKKISDILAVYINN